MTARQIIRHLRQRQIAPDGISWLKKLTDGLNEYAEPAQTDTDGASKDGMP